MTPRVEIAIDELVVRGLSPEAARELAAAVETELTALAARGGEVRAREEAFRRLPPVTAGENGLGADVAAAVWRAVAPTGSDPVTNNPQSGGRR